MGNQILTKGDLVQIPAGVHLLTHNNKQLPPMPSTYKVTVKPELAIVLGFCNNSDQLEVMCSDRRWFVDRPNVNWIEGKNVD